MSAAPPGGPGHTVAAGDETTRDPSEFDEATRDYGVPPAGPGNPFEQPPAGQGNPFEQPPAAQGNPFEQPPAGPSPGPAPGGFGAGAGHGAGPGGRPDPLPPPWIPVPDAPEPAPWQAPADHTTPMPPSGERSTQLGPEPWAAEPAIWRPPAPAKRNNAMYFLVAAGVMLLVVVALGIVFWPSGSAKPARTASGVPSSSQPGQPVTTDGESPTGSPTDTPTTENSPSGDMVAQARAVDGLLAEMSQTRSELGTVVADGCPTDGLQRVQGQRQGQLDRANALDVGALENGTAMKDALVRALQASVASNQRYLDVAPGCPSDDDVADVNQEATDAKNEFAGYWATIAQQAGLPARDGDNI